MKTLFAESQPPIELYVFGDEPQALRAGFSSGAGAHRKYPWMRATSLSRGEDMFVGLRGMVISRIVVTSAALYDAHRYPASAVALDRLRLEARSYLRVSPMVWMEL